MTAALLRRASFAERLEVLAPVEVCFPAMGPRRDGAMVFLQEVPMKHVAAAFLVIGWISEPIPGASPPDDADLGHFRREVTVERNGFSAVDPAKAGLLPPSGLAVPDPFDEEWDPKTVERVLARFDRLLDRFDQALARAFASSDFQVPEVTERPSRGRSGGQVPYLLPWSQLSRLLASRAVLGTGKGKDVQALEDALKLVRFGRLIERSQGNADVYLTGRAVKTLGLFTIIRIVEETDLPGKELKKRLDGLDRFRTEPDEVVDTLKAEYAIFARAVRPAGRGEKGREDPGIDPDRALQVLEEVFRPLIREARRPPPFRRYDTARIHDALAKVPDGPGKREFEQHIGPLAGILGARPITNFALEVTCLQVAMKDYLEAKGDLPPSLDALVPLFSSEVPKDPFDGKPLRYSREKRIIYSVGEDLEDGGGEVPEGRWEWTGRPTFRIELRGSPSKTGSGAGRKKKSP